VPDLKRLKEAREKLLRRETDEKNFRGGSLSTKSHNVTAQKTVILIFPP
jgi:hypothetical protein